MFFLLAVAGLLLFDQDSFADNASEDHCILYFTHPLTLSLEESSGTLVLLKIILQLMIISQNI